MSKSLHAAIAVALTTGVVLLWKSTLAPADGAAVGIGRYSAETILANTAISILLALAAYVAASGRSWKTRASRVLLGLGTLAAIVAAIELPAVLGWIDYRVFLTAKGFGYEGPHNARLDPHWIFRRPPNDHFVSVQEGDTARSLRIDTGLRYRAEWRGDRYGFRNAQEFKHAPIVLVGDSFVEGYKVTQDATVSARLSGLLEEDVCNLGQCDFGPCQEVLAVRRFARPLHPRVVAWFFFEGNDLEDIDEYEEATNDWYRYSCRFDSYSNRSFCNIVRWRLAEWLKRYRRPDLEQVRKHSGTLKPAAGGPTTIYFGLPSVKLGRHEQDLLTKTQWMLGEAKSLCEQVGAKFVVVSVPLKQRVYRDLCDLPADAAPGIAELNDLPDRLADCCRTLEIPFLDLAPALKKAAGQGTLTYFVDDEHWSPEGHAVVAEELARWIKEHVGKEHVGKEHVGKEQVGKDDRRSGS
jgi:hypothetical protein